MYRVWTWLLIVSLSPLYLPQGHPFDPDLSLSITDLSIASGLDNGTSSGSLQPIEKPGGAAPQYSPTDGWNCLCKGTQLEYMIRRAIYEANVPSALKQPSGPLNTPSIFQDPASGLSDWDARTASTAGQTSALVQNLGINDEATSCHFWSAQVLHSFHLLFSMSCQREDYIFLMLT